MTKNQISRCVKLCREFIARAKKVSDEHGKSELRMGFVFNSIHGSAASGALRRTSMELTRALADLRAGAS